MSSTSSTSFSSLASSQPSSFTTSEARAAVETLATDLVVPWDIAFLPSGDLLVTERGGTVKRIGKDHKTYVIDGVRQSGEGGLLGIALHPVFGENGFVYLYLTGESMGVIENRVERYRFVDDTLTDRTVILSDIPAAARHDGGALSFGPDGYLYVTTGDATEDGLAQDLNSLAGKILRIADDGSIPANNPFRNAVYSYGHRNPQGITWDDEGILWSTEHGRSIPLSGYDELNRITKGGNYGWPVIQGSEQRDAMVTPIKHSGANDTWAPASAAYWNGSVYFGGLRAATLYEAGITLQIFPFYEHLAGDYGRIRAVRAGPDGFLYVTTSNRDGRGSMRPGDDRLLRIDPTQFKR